jgi:hypothetical protein
LRGAICQLKPRDWQRERTTLQRSERTYHVSKHVPTSDMARRVRFALDERHHEPPNPSIVLEAYPNRPIEPPLCRASLKSEDKDRSQPSQDSGHEELVAKVLMAERQAKEAMNLARVMKSDLRCEQVGDEIHQTNIDDLDKSLYWDGVPIHDELKERPDSKPDIFNMSMKWIAGALTPQEFRYQ